MRLEAIRVRGPVILLSILLHVAILVPIGLAVPRLIRQPASDFEPIPLDLTPVVPPRVRRSASSVSPSPTGHAASPPSAPLPRVASTTTSGDTPAPPQDGPVIEERWRVNPGPGRVAQIPCPAPPGDRIGRRLCLTGSAMHSADLPGRAETYPTGQDRSEENREEGFERQRRANEAWRDYTRGEGAYPGLRSLFSER